MAFQHRPAVRGNIPLMIGFCGPSGSGKTLSALMMARGIAGPDGIIGALETENGRIAEYAPPEGLSPEEVIAGERANKWFRFEHFDFQPPFSPARYIEGLDAIKKLGAAVAIVDSASHMHEGEGGILDMQEATLKRMSRGDDNRREKLKAASWIEAKAEFHKFVNFATRQNMHIIYCFRARKKLGLAKDANGKTEFVDRGFVPISTEGFESEMTVRLMFPPGAKGVPSTDPEFTRINDSVLDIFEDEQGRSRGAITQKMGRQLAAWASGKSPSPRASASNLRASAPAASPAASPADPAEQDIKSAIDARDRTPAAEPAQPRFTIHKGRTDDGFETIEDWRDRFIAGLVKITDLQAELLLDMNIADMDKYERDYPEEVAAVREAFKEKIGRGE